MKIKKSLPCLWFAYIGVARGLAPPPNRNVTNDKNVTKKPCFFSFSWLYHLCVQQYTRTTIISNNIDKEGSGPLNSFFPNRFKCITQVKLRVFVLKVATSGPDLTF